MILQTYFFSVLAYSTTDTKLAPVCFDRAESSASATAAETVFLLYKFSIMLLS